MAEVASAYVSLMPSARGFGKQLDAQVGGEVDASGKKAGSRWGSALKAGATAGLAALGLAAGKILGDSVKAASEAQQAVGGVEAVFGKYADSVLADSKKAAEGLGLSAAAYNELITVSGAMLKNKGLKTYATDAKELVTVGADLSAMFGGTTTQAVEALNSALRGESDPIEKYGIALNAAAIEAEAVSSGLVKNVKNFDAIKAAQNTAILAQRKYNAALKENGKGSNEALAAESSLIRSKAALTKALDGEKIKLTDSQKAQAALSLVQKQSADATGAFARESNTLAGQQQRLGAEWDNLKVTLGTALLPGLTDAASLARKVVNNFDTIGPVLAAVAGGMLAYKAASLTAAAAAAVQAAGTTAATGATWSLNAALRANPIGLVVTALTLLAAGLIIAYKKSDTFRGIVDKAFSAVKKAAETMGAGIDVVMAGMKKGFEAVGKAGTWLWNNALQPAFKFIIGGVASILDMWSSMLSVLAKVPGFGWAKDAADAMGNAAEKARGIADGIKKIPTSKTVNVTVAYKYTGLKSGTRSGDLGDDILPRLAGGGNPGARAFNQALKEYGDAGKKLMDRVETGIKSSKPKVIEAAQDAFDSLKSKLESKRDDLKGVLDGLRDDFAAIRDSVSSAFAGNLFDVSATTDEAGNVTSSIGKNFIDGLTSKKSELTGLMASFNTLKGWGVSPAFLTQLFTSGNGALITELAGMGQAVALDTANLFGDVTNLSNELGTAVAGNDSVAAEMKIANEQLGQIVQAISYLGAEFGQELNQAAAKAQRDKKKRGKK